MSNEFWIGILFVVIGMLTVYHVYKKPKNTEQIWDWKGYVGGFGSIIFGFFLMFQSMICKNCY